jgi:hypothetical protein
MLDDPSASAASTPNLLETCSWRYTSRCQQVFEDLARTWLQLACDIESSTALLGEWGEPGTNCPLTRKPCKGCGRPPWLIPAARVSTRHPSARGESNEEDIVDVADLSSRSAIRLRAPIQAAPMIVWRFGATFGAQIQLLAAKRRVWDRDFYATAFLYRLTHHFAFKLRNQKADKL